MCPALELTESFEAAERSKLTVVPAPVLVQALEFLFQPLSCL
jgi:hypothetical protein